MWLKFLTDDNLQLVVNRPMSDLSNAVTAMEIGFFSDASAGFKLGFGAILRKKWL